MKIAIDAMGGDNAPVETLKGAVSAINEENDIIVIAVGKKEIIERELSKYQYDKSRVEIVDAREVIEMTDEPVSAMKKKKDSSMRVALSLVKEGTADASVSAGNTGALIATSQLLLRRLKGVMRPAIATLFPKSNYERLLLLDAGATADCKPEFLNQFALMGSKYMEIIMGVHNPKVGLINIGTEEGKGNELTRNAYDLLRANKNINFVGNIEASTYLSEDIDVAVSDGFTGNMVLKASEGVSKLIMNTIKSEVKKSFLAKIGALFLLPSLRKIKKGMDSSEYGGAIFLGLSGISIKAHGSSDANAIKNAIKVANKFAKMHFIEELTKVIDNGIEENGTEETVGGGDAD